MASMSFVHPRVLYSLELAKAYSNLMMGTNGSSCMDLSFGCNCFCTKKSTSFMSVHYDKCMRFFAACAHLFSFVLS